jgi:hypothetical protein
MDGCVVNRTAGIHVAGSLAPVGLKLANIRIDGERCSIRQRAGRRGTDSTGSYVLPEPDLRLRPGATVHIAAPSVGQLEATLVHADGRDLVLRAEGNERTVRLEAGDSLWVLGHATARGAKTGATVGLVLAGALVALFVSTCRAGSDDPCTGAAGFIPAGIVFTGTGALIGAALGRVMPHWERRWP